MERVAQRPCSAGAAEGGGRPGGVRARRALSVRTAGSSPGGSGSPDTAASAPLAWRPSSPARLGVICRICEEPVRARHCPSASIQHLYFRPLPLIRGLCAGAEVNSACGLRDCEELCCGAGAPARGGAPQPPVRAGRSRGGRRGAVRRRAAYPPGRVCGGAAGGRRARGPARAWHPGRRAGPLGLASASSRCRAWRRWCSRGSWAPG